jgi:predicted AlkP superfamily phosphohydrolase/phosphomutase
MCRFFRSSALFLFATFVVAGISAAVGAERAEAQTAAPAKDARVVIVGFDGADADLAAKWMDEGKLPNLAKLREQGTFAPLRSTVPSQTPVSWSTFSTGLSPGRHTIFDFLKRDIKTYRPGFAAAEESSAPFLYGERNPLIFSAAASAVLFLLLFVVAKLFRTGAGKAGLVAAIFAVAAGALVWNLTERWIPKVRPIAINHQQGETFWETLGKAGKRVRVMRMPVTFPAEPFPHGELLSGLGVPDISGRIGKPFYFTSELFFQPRKGNDFSAEVVELIDNKGVIPTEIKGPPNKLFPTAGGLKYITIPATFTVAADKSSVGIEVSGGKLSLKAGEWSDWVRLEFPFNPIISLHGIGRFKVLSIEPEVRVYLSPIQFDPENMPPIVQVTTPGGFLKELTRRFGLFKVAGWTIDTWSLANGIGDEDLFLEDVKATREKEEQMMKGLLADDWDVYVHYFEFTDRVQHMMYRFLDDKHPAYTAEGAAKYGGSILAAYQDMDRIVGEVIAGMPKDATLFVVSDHGFVSWRRTMNYNTWLATNGYLVLKGQSTTRANLEDLFDNAGSFFSNVDWSRTRAYAMGLGNIYVNLKGREAQGIVENGEQYQTLIREIKTGLEAFVDAETGDHPVAYVWTRDEAYGKTYDPQLIPDLFPSNGDGYRVGWQDSLGMVAPAILEANTDPWSGDHCSVYPPLVDGILFSNRKLDTSKQPYMADVMPTLLEVYGVAPPTQLDGRSLWPR